MLLRSCLPTLSHDGRVELIDPIDMPRRTLSRQEAREWARVVVHEAAKRLPPEVAAELIAPFVYRRPGRPPKTAPSKEDERNDLLRALRVSDRRYSKLSNVDAAKFLRREFGEWVRLSWPRTRNAEQPAHEPDRTFFTICRLGLTRPLEIKTIENIFARD